MKSFPKHFHGGSDEAIREGEFGEDPKIFFADCQGKNPSLRGENQKHRASWNVVVAAGIGCTIS